MALININFLQLSRSYLFSKIGEKVKTLKEKNSDISILNLGIGDIALPLAPTIVESLKEAADAMGEQVYGYGSADGDLCLREKILETEYSNCGFETNEIFISDGIVRDICDIQDLFSPTSTVGIIDPTYPAYVETTILAGKKIHLIPCLEENGFIPIPPKYSIDLVYLCSPNNPTGIAMTRAQIKVWIDWAKEHKSVILFDAAYAAFITSSDVPKTIYEIEGAKEVAIEFRSFSKSAGFTGLRLGYTIIPKKLLIISQNNTHAVNSLWRLRQDVKTNGISYPIQKAGYSTLFGEGKREVDNQVRHYAANAKKLRIFIESLGFTCYGGIDSPYIWWKINSSNSWEFFDFLLNEFQIITIPGRGFGIEGEGFIRLSGFITEETLNQTINRLTNKLSNTGDKLCAMK